MRARPNAAPGSVPVIGVCPECGASDGLVLAPSATYYECTSNSSGHTCGMTGDAAKFVEGLSARVLDLATRPQQWESDTWEQLGAAEGVVTWDYAEAVWCGSCDRPVADTEDHAEGCTDGELDARGLGGEGPMMNYWYPIDGMDLDGMYQAAPKLVHLPLVAVQVGDEFGIALSGGGMHFGWEICEAFMVLGYLPPLCFTDLPRMAGKEREADTPLIVAACQRSNRMVIEQAQRRIDRLAADYEGATR